MVALVQFLDGFDRELFHHFTERMRIAVVRRVRVNSEILDLLQLLNANLFEWLHLAFQLPLDAVQNAIDELRRLLSAEATRDLNRFVDDHGLGSFFVEQKFLACQTKQITVYSGHAVQPPVLGMTLDQRVDLFHVLHGLYHELACESNDTGFFILAIKKSRGNLIDAVAGDIPLKQHLQGVFSGFAPWSHQISPSTLIIWKAAIAASNPLLPDSPERSIACSTVSTVRTPKPTGIPVSSATRCSPSLTARLMYSKCSVSPRSTHPSATIPSYFFDKAACFTAIGISKDPGTRMRFTCF